MKPVIIESPYAGCVPLHKAYLQACIRDCLTRGETPYASHQQLTDALDDNVKSERKLGMDAGLEMRDALKRIGAISAFYIDLRYSGGMTAARATAETYEEREIVDGDEWERILNEAQRDKIFAKCFSSYITSNRGAKCCAETALYVRADYIDRIKE